MIVPTMPVYAYVLVGVVAVAVGAGVVVALAIHRLGRPSVTHRFHWGSWTGFRGKTLWDWLQLLVVPVALAGIALGFNFLQSARELGIARKAREAEARAAQEARRDQALSAYLQRMSDLTLRHDLVSRPTADVAALARTLTLTVLRRLDGRRKGQVINFLDDSGLIRKTLPTLLTNADLRDVDMSGGILGDENTRTSLIGANLRRANFTAAFLTGVDFRYADLRGARFDDALITRAKFGRACLSHTHFHDASLARSSFTYAVGHHIDFSNALLTDTTVSMRHAVGLTHLTVDHIRGADDFIRAVRPSKEQLTTEEQELYCRSLPIGP